MKYIAERAENHRHLLTHDPRTEIEKQTAIRVIHLARPDNLLKIDVRAMYQNALNIVGLNSVGKNLHSINKLIIKSNTTKLEALQGEIIKANLNKEAWKNMFVPSYFESEWGKKFLDNELGYKDGNFLQTSENYFNDRGDNIMNKDKYLDSQQQHIEEARSVKKSTLPPISSQKTFESSSIEKRGFHIKIII